MKLEDKKTIDDFAQEAKDFCKLVENYREYDRGLFLYFVAQSISRLIYLVLRFPAYQELEDTDRETNKPNVDANYYRALSELFGDWNHYREIFNATAKSDDSMGEVVDGSLADDVSDIYMDIRKGLSFYDRGTAASLNEAIFEWGFSFGIHWGRHATSALRAIYCRLDSIISETQKE